MSGAGPRGCYEQRQDPALGARPHRRGDLRRRGGGILTGFASIGISPEHFNLQDPALLIKVALVGSAVSAVIGVAGYLQKSPLPPE
jgi:hypothetical protein